MSAVARALLASGGSWDALAVLVAVELDACASEGTGTTFVSAQTIAVRLGASRDSVLRRLAALSGGGLIVATGRRVGRGGSPEYRLTWLEPTHAAAAERVTSEPTRDAEAGCVTSPGATGGTHAEVTQKSRTTHAPLSTEARANGTERTYPPTPQAAKHRHEANVRTGIADRGGWWKAHEEALVALAYECGLDGDPYPGWQAIKQAHDYGGAWPEDVRYPVRFLRTRIKAVRRATA